MKKLIEQLIEKLREYYPNLTRREIILAALEELLAQQSPRLNRKEELMIETIYEVNIPVEVTADNEQQALRYALDDLRDMSIDGHWTASIKNLNNDIVKITTQTEE